MDNKKNTIKHCFLVWLVLIVHDKDDCSMMIMIKMGRNEEFMIFNASSFPGPEVCFESSHRAFSSAILNIGLHTTTTQSETEHFFR